MGGCNTKKTKSGINRCRRGGNNGSRTQAGQRGRRRTAAQPCLIYAFVGLLSLATCARIRRSADGVPEKARAKRAVFGGIGATPTCIYYTGARRMVKGYTESIAKVISMSCKGKYINFNDLLLGNFYSK